MQKDRSSQIRRGRRRHLIPFLGCVALALSLLPGVRDAAAQNVLRIAAVVNEDVISAMDLGNRLMFVIATTGLEPSAETEQRLAPQILRNLIDERLQLQEARRLNISVSDSEIDRAIANIERSNDIPEGQLIPNLESEGIDTQTLRDRLRAQLAWSRVVSRRFGPSVAVGNDEVDEALRRIEAQQEQTQYRVAEIFLTVNAPDEDPQIRQGAERLIEQLRAGASFSAVAREFSQSATAAVGGDLGWLSADQLDPALQPVVPQLLPGQISVPIRSPSGYHIVLMIEQRQPVQGEETILTLRQVVLPFPADATEREIEAQRVVAEQVRSTANDCPAMEQAAETVGSPRADRGGEVRLSQLPPDIRPTIQSLRDNEASEPIRTAGSFIIVMVCNRSTGGAIALPPRDEVERQLMDDRLDLHGQRYLRELRRTAFLDIRG